MKKKLLLVGIGSLVGQNISELDLSSYEIFLYDKGCKKMWK